MNFKTKTFQGSTPFPIEMLRVDQCYPVSQTDVNEIYISIADQDTIAIRRVTVQSHHGFFNLRNWEVFGWIPFDEKEIALDKN